MSDKSKKQSLSYTRAAWKRHANSAPILTEEWLRSAIPAVKRKNVVVDEGRLPFFMGVAVSAAVSVLVFVSSTIITTSNLYDDSALAYLRNSHYFSSLLASNYE